MATSFREWPWPLQAVFYVALAVVIVAAGFYLPFSPVRTVRSDLEAAQNSLKPLETEVQSLRVYKQRRAELQSEMDALQKQLETLQTIVPEEKQVDQFILMIQSAAIEFGRLDPQADCEAGYDAALLLRDAVRYRGRRPVFFGARFLRAARASLANHQRGRSEDVVVKRWHQSNREVPHRSRGFGDRHIYDYDFLYESGGCLRGACCRAGK